MKSPILVATIAVTAALSTQQPRVSIGFSPESEVFADAARDYQTLWTTEGARIIEAIESVSALAFPETEVQAIVYEGVSRSGHQEVILVAATTRSKNLPVFAWFETAAVDKA